MLAAQGALRFCSEYAAVTASPPTRIQLMNFFGKAMAVADELSRGLASAASVTQKAHNVAAPFFEAVGKEMRVSERMAHRHTKAKKPAKAGRKAAARRKSAAAGRSARRS